MMLPLFTAFGRAEEKLDYKESDFTTTESHSGMLARKETEKFSWPIGTF